MDKMQCCPYCGSEIYYIKQSFKGVCEYFMRFDGETADNESMYDNSGWKNRSKYAWCAKCHKRLFKLEE